MNLCWDHQPITDHQISSHNDLQPIDRSIPNKDCNVARSMKKSNHFFAAVWCCVCRHAAQQGKNTETGHTWLDQECETKLEMHRVELPAANNHEPKIENERSICRKAIRIKRGDIKESFQCGLLIKVVFKSPGKSYNRTLVWKEFQQNIQTLQKQLPLMSLSGLSWQREVRQPYQKCAAIKWWNNKTRGQFRVQHSPFRPAV